MTYNTGKDISERLNAMISYCIAPLLLVCCTSFAQTAPTAEPTHAAGQASTVSTHATSQNPAAAPNPQSGAPDQRKPSQPSSFNATIHPATVSLRDGKLTVEANNSDLSQILQNLATISGMTIDGLHKGPRVFGVYGPGNSREVLSALLVGSGYNFVMVGGAEDGAPRELLLTSQKSAAGTAVASSPSGSQETESDDAEGPEQPEQPEENIAPPEVPDPNANPQNPDQAPDPEGDQMQKSLQQLRQGQPITPPQ
jgi:hypothetical protein